MSDAFLERTLRLMGQILGLGAVKIPQRTYPDPNPPPLARMGQDEVDQFMAQRHNAEVAQMLSQPGAMVLDTPLSRGRTDKEMMEDFERTGVTQRPARQIQESDLPRGTLTSRAIGVKP
jgi:hypothetical protein